MKSNVRRTKQGILDLNYYGPRRNHVAAVAPVEEALAKIPEEVAAPADEAAKVAERTHEVGASDD